MINQIRYDDLLSMTEELDGMLVNHVEWLTLLHKTIVCNLPFSNSLLRDLKTCEFGKWYYSVTHPAVTESPEFIHLGRIHNNLHTIANRILEQYKNNVITQESEYDSFVDVEKEFFDTFNNFIENVLSTKSQFDHMTNLPNRNLITLILEKEYSRVKRNNGDCCIAFADIDHFKHVNDTYGHASGDRVLTELSGYFSSSIRPYDSVGRYGGEEFMFCFPQTELSNASEFLERIRSGIEGLSIRIDKSNTIKVTCSFGLTRMRGNKSLTEIIKQADNAMYAAKDNGRNRLKVWSDGEA